MSRLGKPLTAAKVFTSMVLYNSIRDPLSQFPDTLQALIQARISLDRMSKYLSAEEVDPTHIARDTENYSEDMEISVEDATFKWQPPPPKKEGNDFGKEATESTPLKEAADLQNYSPKSAAHNDDLPDPTAPLTTTKSPRRIFSDTFSKTGIFSRGEASQQPWIQNMSIRDDILFGLPYDKTKYDRVLDACGLLKDIAMFPAGDATEIGQKKGVNLSGGQKARVSLARACYADADVYVLDSPLAAVDAIVQSEIFNKCLCGLLEKKTVILVTHLHDIIASDVANVKVSLDGGKAQVTYGERSKSRREYANLHTSAEDGEVAEAKDIVDSGGKKPVLRVGFWSKRKNVKMEACLSRYSRHTSLPWSFQISSDLWLSHWTGSKPGTEVASSVEYNMTVYALLDLGTGVFALFRALVTAKIFTQCSIAIFDTNPIGRILNRYAEDFSTINLHIPFELPAYLYQQRSPSSSSPQLSTSSNGLGAFFLASSRELSRLKKIANSPILSHLIQSEEGVAALRSHGQSYVDREISKSLKLNDTSNRVRYAQALTSVWFRLRMHMIGFSVVVFVVTSLLTFHAYVSPRLVGLAFMYAVSIDLKLALWVKWWSWLEMSMVSSERVMEYIDIPPEGHASDLLIVSTGPTNEEWPQCGAIAFDGVKFAYKPGGDLVLKGLLFDIRHNEEIGIVGRTGAGISSLTMAIFRINELVSGRIVLDGVDISTVNLQTLRSHMSIIPQVPVLFKGTLRAYMDPFEEYDDAEIWLAFEKVALKDMVSGLDGKLQHELSDKGENFSVGERQMLCMSRALLRKSRVVVMDEATASIDRATEQKLQAMIQREFVDATVLTIAHRLSTVLDSDRILVLSDGRVAEFDTPRALAQIEGCVFRELAKEGGYLC